MAKVKQSLKVDGAKLSNKDPNLVIKLDDHPNVFIQDIGEDTITYGFNGNVDEDQVYELNVTFTYMGLISYTAPLRITQRHLAEAPIIVDVKPIDVEANQVYQAPFRVILPVSGRDITSGFVIDKIVDNAGTHTDYLSKAGGLYFKAETSDLTDYAGIYKFTVTGTHNGAPVTLSADIPVTIKKWVGDEYAIVKTDGNTTPVVGVINGEDSFSYQLKKRNLIVPAAQFKADLTVLGTDGVLTNLSEADKDTTTKTVSFTYGKAGTTNVFLTATDTAGKTLATLQIPITISLGDGLNIYFTDPAEQNLEGNLGDVMRVIPTIIYGGVKLSPSDPKIKLYAKTTGTDNDSTNVSVVDNQGSVSGWDVQINVNSASTSGGPQKFMWRVTHEDAPDPAEAQGSVYVFADTPSVVTGAFTSALVANTSQSVTVKFEQPTYGSGPNWRIAGGKLTEAVLQVFDKATGNQVGTDLKLTNLVLDKNGTVLVNIPSLPYLATTVKITGKLLAKNGTSGVGPNYTPVPINPVITQEVKATPLIASPSDVRINYFNNAMTKVTFILTQEQGGNKVPVNAIDISELTVTGKGFTNDVKPTKETAAGTYSINVGGTGEIGDVVVGMKVQYPTGDFQAVTFGLRAVKIVPTFVDAPLSPAMWDYGDKPPFKVMLGANDVTSQITGLRPLDNPYVIPDPTPGSGTKRAWHLLYSTTEATTIKIPFSFNLTVDGVVDTFEGSGTFNLPAWDGIGLVVKPSGADTNNKIPADNPDSFKKFRIKVGQTKEVWILFMVKGTTHNEPNWVATDTTKYDDAGGAVRMTDNLIGQWNTPRKMSVTGLKVGTFHPSMYYYTGLAYGYPDRTPPLNVNFWTPEVEIWDDILLATPASQTVEATEMKTIEVPLSLTWNGNPLDWGTTGITTSIDNDIFVFQNYTTKGIVYKVNKEILEAEVQNAKITVNYGGKSSIADVKFNIVVDQFKQLQIVDQPINAKVWDSGTTIPFKLMDNGVDITDQAIDLDFVPTLYIIKNPEGAGWYVDTAESVARDVKVKYTFKLKKNGVTVPFEYQGTFKLAAWDGVTLRVAAKYGIFEREFPVMLDGTNSYTFYPTYKGKAAPEDVILESVTGFVNGGTAIVSQVTSEDGKGVVVTLRGTGKAGGNTVTFRYRKKGTTGGVINKDYFDDTSVSFQISGAGLILTGPSGANPTPNPVTPNGASTYTCNLYCNGIRVDLRDPNLRFVIKAGNQSLGLDYIGATATGFVSRVMSSGTFHNRFDIFYTDPNGTNYSLVDGNMNVTVSGTAKYLGISGPAGTVTPSADNKLLADIRVQPNNTSVTSIEPYLPYKITKTPSNGSPIVNPEDLAYVYEDGKMYIKFAAGHTGDSFTVQGYVQSSAGYLMLVPTTYTVPKAPVTSTLDAANYTSDDNNQITVKFKLSQPRYKQDPYNFAGASFEAITMTGATGSGQVTEADGWFTIVLTVPPTGTSAKVTGTVKDVDNWKYPFTLDIVINPPVDLVMNDGFQTTGAGDKDTPLTLTQGTSRPN